MKRLTRPRRSLWLVLGLVIAGLATAAAVAVAGLQARGSHVHAEIRVADDEHRRRSGVGQELLRRSDGRTGSGASGTWDAPLNMDSNYANEARSVADEGRELAGSALEGAEPGDRARRRRHDTDHLELRALQQLGLQPDHECPVRRPDGQPTFTGNMFPATPGMLDLVNQAKAQGYAIFWITGRGDSQHAATIANLVNDTAAGLPDIATVTLNGKTIPEVDADYAGAHADRHRPRRLHRRPVHQAAGRLVPGLPRHARVLRAVHPRHSRGVVSDHPVQVRDARLHRVAGLRHRRRLRRPVQRSPGRLRGQDVQDAEPELLPPVGQSQRSTRSDTAATPGAKSRSGGAAQREDPLCSCSSLTAVSANRGAGGETAAVERRPTPLDPYPQPRPPPTARRTSDRAPPSWAPTRSQSWRGGRSCSRTRAATWRRARSEVSCTRTPAS